MKDFEIRYRRLSELGVDGDEVRPQVLNVLSENPFRNGKDVLARKVAIVDGRVGGYENEFPVNVSINGEIYEAGTGNCTIIEPWARKSGIGIVISDFDEHGRDGSHHIAIGGALSQIAIRVHKFIGYVVHEFPRFVFLLRSRVLLETRIKGLSLRISTLILDACIGLYIFAVRSVSVFKLFSCTTEQVLPDKLEDVLSMAKIVRADGKSYCEVHDEKWLRWVLSSTFSEQKPCKAFLVKRGSNLLGFFLVKRRFHEHASSRGFKNVWLTSVVEWGAYRGFENKVYWAIVRYLFDRRRGDDAVEFATNEKPLISLLRHLLWKQVGNANFCFKIRGGSALEQYAEEMSSIDNWRVRPAYGDYALS